VTENELTFSSIMSTRSSHQLQWEPLHTSLGITGPSEMLALHQVIFASKRKAQ